MRTKPRFSVLCFGLAICWAAMLDCLSCEARTREVFNVLGGQDIVPPRLVKIEASSSDRIEIAFDEPVFLVKPDFPFPTETERNVVALLLPAPLAPGDEMALGGTVIDEAGNRTSFRGSVFGFNPSIPDALITELTTSGTGNSPDRTEIAVLSDGNMAGLCLCDGIGTDFTNRFVFPDCQVGKGDYVVVCWDGASQGGPLVFHAGAGTGLSKHNGIQSLFQTPAPDAACLDCLIYANHNGTAHNKFGAKETLRRAREAVAQGFWVLAPGENDVTGLSAVDSSKTTATRSMARKFPYIDTDTASDWYVTATRGSTFGGDNTSSPYEGGL